MTRWTHGPARRPVWPAWQRWLQRQSDAMTEVDALRAEVRHLRDEVVLLTAERDRLRGTVDLAAKELSNVRRAYDRACDLIAEPDSEALRERLA